MRAVWLEVPSKFLEERRRLGHDRKDELWDGVLHMVPPGSFAHAFVIKELVFALEVVARYRGMRAYPSELGIYDGDDNYRIPDITIVRREHCTERGLNGADLVVEVLSPNDESREKQPFYAERGIRESWIIDPISRAHEIYELRRGKYNRVRSRFGVTRSPTFGIELSIIDGPLLQLVDGKNSYAASI
jgi:Uma2 family endonuclease